MLKSINNTNGTGTYEVVKYFEYDDCTFSEGETFVVLEVDNKHNRFSLNYFGSVITMPMKYMVI